MQCFAGTGLVTILGMKLFRVSADFSADRPVGSSVIEPAYSILSCPKVVLLGSRRLPPFSWQISESKSYRSSCMAMKKARVSASYIGDRCSCAMDVDTEFCVPNHTVTAIPILLDL